MSPAPPMNNQEPIKLATQPGGYRRAEDDVAPVDRDDFPAPPAKNLGKGEALYRLNNYDQEKNDNDNKN